MTDESLKAENNRLVDEIIALRARIQELEARGGGEHRDWIGPTVHAEAVQEMRDEIDRLTGLWNVSQRRARIAQAIIGALLKVLVSADRQDEALGSMMVSITERMGRK